MLSESGQAERGAMLSQLFGDDYVEITLQGKRVLKSEVVAGSPQIDEIDVYSMDDEKVAAIGLEAAILSYHLTLEGLCRGEAITPRHRWATSAWTRTTGDWRCCFFQQSHFSEDASDD